MAERLKTFFKGMVTAADFIDGKFTILENDANTQAVVRSLSCDSEIEDILWDINGVSKAINLVTQDHATGSGAGVYLTYAKAEYPPIYSNGKFILNNSLVEDLSVQLKYVKTALGNELAPIQVFLTNSGDLLFHYNTTGTYHNYAGGGDGYGSALALFSHNAEGVYALEMRWEYADIWMGLGLGYHTVAHLQQDPVTGKIYMLSPAAAKGLYLCEFDDAVGVWKLIDGWDIEKDYPSLGVEGLRTVKIYDGLMFVAVDLGDNETGTFIVVDLSTGIYDQYVLDYPVRTTGGFILIKDGNSPNRFFIGSLVKAYPLYAMVFPTPSGLESDTLPDAIALTPADRPGHTVVTSVEYVFSQCPSPNKLWISTTEAHEVVVGGDGEVLKDEVLQDATSGWNQFSLPLTEDAAKLLPDMAVKVTGVEITED